MLQYQQLHSVTYVCACACAAKGKNRPLFSSQLSHTFEHPVTNNIANSKMYSLLWNRSIRTKRNTSSVLLYCSEDARYRTLSE